MFSLRQTCEQATRGPALDYTGASTDEEALEWLSSVFLFQVEALTEVDGYHSCFPWRAICCLNPQLRSETLAAMKKEWMFVLDVVDNISERHPLHTLLSFTRYQAYRDIMTKAEPPFLLPLLLLSTSCLDTTYRNHCNRP